jgi:uncharacterized protein
MAVASSDKPKLKRGLAAISPERQREITSMGGKSVPAESRAFTKRKDLAYEAGKRGGLATARNRSRTTTEAEQRKAPPVWSVRRGKCNQKVDHTGGGPNALAHVPMKTR